MAVVVHRLKIPPKGMTATPAQTRVAAAIIFAFVKAGWPVDTGRSKRGLSYRLKGSGRRVTMEFVDRYDYAVYVERFHYPIDRELSDRRLRQTFRRAKRLKPDERKKLSSQVGGIKRITGTVSGLLRGGE